MDTMKNRIILLIIVFFFSPLALNQTIANEEEYFCAKEAVESGYKDFAFVNFLSIVKNSPGSRYRQDALFAVIEYYFLSSNYTDAFSASVELLDNYPDSEMRPFVLFYLLKISQAWGNDDLTKIVQTQIKNLKRIVLIFKETEDYKFKSPLGLSYRVAYYIDKLEFYLDGKLQAQISY